MSDMEQNDQRDARLTSVSTAHLADACLIVGVDVRCAPSALRPVGAPAVFAGPAQPVRHTGSVDVVLEAIGRMPAGAVLVIDDDGRTDRACIGDLTAIEALHAGAAAMIVNGLHRDTGDLIEIGLPVISLGSSPTGPLEWSPSPLDAFERCRLGPWEITIDDLVVGDLDGVIILPIDRVNDIAAAAVTIRDRERRQAGRAREGMTLRQQFAFDEYLADRQRDPNRTFRQHLADRSLSIEA